MNYNRVESAREICYEVKGFVGFAKEGLSRLTEKAQNLFKQLVKDGEISVSQLPLVITEESYSGKDLALCYKITSEHIESRSRFELFAEGPRSYISINLDGNRFCAVISKS